jgi:imidazolonepropionase-like amidohydrolase
MRIDIVNGNVVTGDGRSLLENTSAIIQDGFITDLPRVRYIPYNAYADRIINAEDGFIIPGIINLHTHGVSFGPFFPYAWKRLSKQRVLENLNNHLLQGTTTVLNCDGLTLPSEVQAANKIHPVNIKMCTLHTPKNIVAAEVTAGYGIKKRHRTFTAKEAVSLGAIALGEVGSPSTSFGTAEKSMKLGRAISGQHAQALNEAVFAGDETEISRVLLEVGIENVTIDEAKKLVEETSIIPVEASCNAIKESAIFVEELGIPAIVHTEERTKDTVLQASKELHSKLTAVHVNYLGTDEAVRFAKQLRGFGSFVEIVTLDQFGAKQIATSPEVTYALLKEDLVDVITTDFSGGYHDPILLVLQKAIEEGVITLPRAIQLATSAPAEIIPRVAPNRGLIESGKVADLCVVDRDDISRVKHVIISGRMVVEDGKLIKQQK